MRRLIARETLHVVNDRHTDTGRPLIYDATHIGYSDVEMIYSAIKSHAYIFWGDPHELYRRIEGFLLGLNGTICCDTSLKSDRHIGKETCVRLLNQGGSLLIYPEGYSDIFLSKFNVPMGVDDPIEEINRTRYRHKGVTEPDEAFRFMKYLKPCRENAFLFARDRNDQMFGLGSKGER